MLGKAEEKGKGGLPVERWLAGGEVAGLGCSTAFAGGSARGTSMVGEVEVARCGVGCERLRAR